MTAGILHHKDHTALKMETIRATSWINMFKALNTYALSRLSAPWCSVWFAFSLSKWRQQTVSSVRFPTSILHPLVSLSCYHNFWSVCGGGSVNLSNKFMVVCICVYRLDCHCDVHNRVHQNCQMMLDSILSWWGDLNGWSCILCSPDRCNFRLPDPVYWGSVSICPFIGSVKH